MQEPQGSRSTWPKRTSFLNLWPRFTQGPEQKSLSSGINEAAMIQVPSALHDVLGQRQTALSLAAIGAALVGAGVVFAALDGAHADLAVWRRVLAFLLFLDLAAGAVANVTAGTNAHYAQSARRRWVFIAIHIHLPVFALLMGLPLAPYLMIWVYVFVTVSGLTLALAHPEQRVLAALVMVLGLMALPLLGLEPLGAVAASLYIVKLCYAFAVNHAVGRE
jgi:hypothetical protein